MTKKNLLEDYWNNLYGKDIVRDMFRSGESIIYEGEIDSVRKKKKVKKPKPIESRFDILDL